MYVKLIIILLFYFILCINVYYHSFEILNVKVLIGLEILVFVFPLFLFFVNDLSWFPF